MEMIFSSKVLIMIKTVVLFILSLLLLSLHQASAQTYIVSAVSTAAYRNIQDAINSAPGGSIVLVKPGTYKGPVIMKEGVSLQGEGSPLIDGNNSGAVVTMASDSYISGFRIMHSGSESGVNYCGILVKNAVNTIIFNNEICNNGHYGIIINRGSCNVHYNNIHTNDLIGVYVLDSSEFDIGYNNIQFHSLSAIDIVGKEASGKIYNNHIGNNHYGILNCSYTPGYIDIMNNIFFLNTTGIFTIDKYSNLVIYNCFYLNDKHYFNGQAEKTMKLERSNKTKNPGLSFSPLFEIDLKRKSPCINGGTHGEDIGIFRYDNGKENNATNKPYWKSDKAKYFFEMKGKATNITADNKVSDFTCYIHSNDGIHYEFLGQYDNIKLFGIVEMSGIIVSSTNHPNIKIDFNEGWVYLGNDNSGFPRGFKLSHTATVEINNGKVTGSYICGSNKPYLDFEQFGSYEMDITRASKKIQE